MVTGESGAGKTCVTRATRYALESHAVRLTYCDNVTLGRRDFYGPNQAGAYLHTYGGSS